MLITQSVCVYLKWLGYCNGCIEFNLITRYEIFTGNKTYSVLGNDSIFFIWDLLLLNFKLSAHLFHNWLGYCKEYIELHTLQSI